jgi:hypothetical protein
VPPSTVSSWRQSRPGTTCGASAENLVRSCRARAPLGEERDDRQSMERAPLRRERGCGSSLQHLCRAWRWRGVGFASRLTPGVTGGRLKLLRLQLVGAALSTVGHGASIFVQNKGLLVRRTRQYCSLDPPLAQHRATCLAKTLCHNH